MATATDEESFVILSNSPYPSLTSHKEDDGSCSSADPIASSSLNLQNTSIITNKLINDPLALGDSVVLPSATKPLVSFNTTVTKYDSVKSVEETTKTSLESNETARDAMKNVEETKTTSIENNGNQKEKNVVAKEMDNSMSKSWGVMQPETKPVQATLGNESNSINDTAVTDSLASKFILGSIDVESMKQSIYTQMPSIASLVQSDNDDSHKLRSIILESAVLKKTLGKLNQSIKLYYNQSQQWHNELQASESQYKSNVNVFHQQIAQLRNENIELNRQVTGLTEQITVQNQFHQTELDSLTQSMSEKSALIGNLAAQIQKLDEQQLTSFECLNNIETCKEKKDYVDRVEHERAIKELERKMSETLAENLDYKDVQTQYIDELNTLKVNLTAAEELIGQLRADINMLKAENLQKSEEFKSFEEERGKIREEVAILRQQLDIYQKDFGLEREARENMASERSKLLQDMSGLQRHNQELIAKMQETMKATVNELATTQESFKTIEEKRPIRQPLPNKADTAPEVKNFTCPICNKAFMSLELVTQHVDVCLKD